MMLYQIVNCNRNVYHILFQSLFIMRVPPMRGKANRRMDLRFEAQPPGMRVSDNGNIYWETRRNRSDRSRANRL